MTIPFRLGRFLNSNGVKTVDGSFSSTPWIVLNTSATSLIERHMGPGRSWPHDSPIPPCRVTRPNVGRSALSPLRVDGEMIEPAVSVPMEKPTHPAAVAEPGPADEPLDPCAVFQGFLVCPRNQLSPDANSPV